MASVGQKPSTGQPAGPERDERAFVGMATRAKALVPQLRDRAARTEELRRLPPETERDLHEAGLFRIVQPKRVGGSEFDYVALVDCAEILGKADASVAWNFGNLASHHWMLGMFDKRAQDAVWDQDPNALIASSFIFPAGRARKVEGGYQLRGRWPFSSLYAPFRERPCAPSKAASPEESTPARRWSYGDISVRKQGRSLIRAPWSPPSRCRPSRCWTAVAGH